MNEINNRINQIKTKIGLAALFNKYSVELERMDEEYYDFKLIPYSIMEDGTREPMDMHQLTHIDYIDVVYSYRAGTKYGNVLKTYNALECIEAFEENIINSPNSPIEKKVKVCAACGIPVDSCPEIGGLFACSPYCLSKNAVKLAKDDDDVFDLFKNGIINLLDKDKTKALELLAFAVKNQLI